MMFHNLFQACENIVENLDHYMVYLHYLCIGPLKKIFKWSKRQNGGTGLWQSYSTY